MPDKPTTRTVACPYCTQKHTVEFEDEMGAFLCKYPTDNGPCQRGVDSPTEYCWQHTENE